MDELQVKELLAKYNAGECTAEEKALLETWYLRHNQDVPHGIPGNTLEQATDRIWARLDSGQHRNIRPLWYSPLRIAAAASIVLAMSVTGYFVLRHKSKPTLTAINEIKPGSNGAILTLSNGQKIVLEQAKTGTITQQNGSRVQKANDSLLEYKAATTSNTVITYNTLETPAGKQYAVVLPDGTKAWLNAASSLKYPTVFNGRERLVELTGEAYFEVIHNARQPFKVQTASEVIEDIGTHFDVNAYNDEPVQKTTLVEGAIKVTAGDEVRKLQPGQQAALTDNTLTIAEVDVQQATAWKDGYFYFDHADIKAVMRQIARWYNVKVVYQGQLPKKSFKGKIYRNVSIAQALKILEFFNVHYKIEGNQVTVIG